MLQIHSREFHARLSAGAIAAGASIGLIPPFQIALADGMGLLEAVWHLLRPFTIITNLLIVVIFGCIALRGTARVPSLFVGAIMLGIVMVGIIFNFVLGQMPQLNWWTFLGDSLHHHVAPIAVPLWWIVFAPHGNLGWHAPLVWMLYPLIYCVYGLVRAEFEPNAPIRYIYFFMNVDEFGWAAVLLNIGAIGVAFTLLGYLVMLLDWWLVRSASTRPTGQPV